jgi:hypothetical protein
MNEMSDLGHSRHFEREVGMIAANAANDLR